MCRSASLNTLNTTRSTEVFSARNARTSRTAISAAAAFGKWNSPVEMQQNATDFSPFFAASVRQER